MVGASSGLGRRHRHELGLDSQDAALRLLCPVVPFMPSGPAGALHPRPSRREEASTRSVVEAVAE
jgi:hypothetical protein